MRLHNNILFHLFIFFSHMNWFIPSYSAGKSNDTCACCHTMSLVGKHVIISKKLTLFTFSHPALLFHVGKEDKQTLLCNLITEIILLKMTIPTKDFCVKFCTCHCLSHTSCVIMLTVLLHNYLACLLIRVGGNCNLL